MNPRIGIIGAGRVGSALAHYAISRGASVRWIVDCDAAALERMAEHFPETWTKQYISDIHTTDTDICILAVPDTAIPDVAHALADADVLPRSTLVMHTSGVLSSDALWPLAARGYTCGAAHPMQSFPALHVGPPALVGIGCGIEGCDEFRTLASDFAHFLEWRPLHIDTTRKELYHASCVIAGNFLTVLAAQADTLLHLASLSEDGGLPYLLPMMETVLSRLRVAAPAHVLTGPAARGDLDAITAHARQILAYAPDLFPSYRALTLEAAKLGGLSTEQIIDISESIDNATSEKP